MENIIEINNLSKLYKMGNQSVQALNSVNLSVAKGEFVAIMGMSGSGKSTLMNIIGCLDEPTSGEIFIDDIPVAKLNKIELADIRNGKIGFVFQGFNLLSRTTAIENVELPLLYNRKNNGRNNRKKAVEALKRVGLAERMYHTSSELSGGQQQRVAIARALVNDPVLILADEPTGNLDSRTSVEIFDLFQKLNEEGITVVMVTHERDFASFAKRIVEMRDGKIIRDFQIKNRLNATEKLESLDLFEEELAEAEYEN